VLKGIGSALITLGALLGVAVGIAMLTGVQVISVPWLIAVGIAKLTLFGSGALMAGGAVCLRLDRRRRERELLGPSTGGIVER
jgi:hypothetical protein